MTCGSCGEKNRDAARFCAECGAALEHACVTCDAPLTPTAKFCDQCGTPVGVTPDDESSDGQSNDDEAVRKTVTVMFADLVGSTAFGEAVDAEAARREMSAYHQLAQRVIDRHQGTLVKFIGDGVMAVFGIPEIAEDDADRAIRAGLDLQGEFRTIADGILERHGAAVGLRVGINTGEIVIAEDDDDMVGDAINTAARIEAECTPGQVLVGEQTWRLTRSNVDYEVLGEVHVKGKEEGVATFRVLAATDEEITTPFVGREDELLRLRATLDDTIDDRRARLVSVIGAPGVGKTRLAAEMSDRAGEGVTAFDLRVDRAATATFGPIADLLAAVPDAARRAADAADADRLVPLLETFAGSAPPRSTEESFWAARRLVELIAADGPAVIVVDDVQWAQPLFLDLLDHLVEWVVGPVLIVALARPEIREIRPILAERGRRVADVISLEGLDAATTEILAARILGAAALPPGLAERLPESTEGNPLFVRELVRMLVDDGTIEERDGTWSLSIDADAVEVPPTIQSLLASRVERMDDDARRVVEMAAVVGSEFARGAVAALLPDMARTSLDRILEGLRRREILDPTGTYWGDEPVLRFHHVLIRDAAYRRLLKERRADLHIEVANWTERMAEATGGDHGLAIAFHLEQAHDYLRELGSLDDVGIDAGSRAADLLDQAAAAALQQDDLAAAGTLATRALALVDGHDPRRAGLLLTGCEAFFQSARVNDGDPLLDELVAISAGDTRLTAWATAYQCHRVALTEPNALVDAEPRVAAAADALESLGDDAGVAKARLVRALILARLGRVGACETELDGALSAARAADDRRRITSVLGAAPVAALWGPSPVARAGGRCLDIIRLLRITSASPMVEATSIRCQAVLEAMRGRFDEARQLVERSRAIVDELGLRHGALETDVFAGYIELLADDPAAAEPPLRRAYEGLGQLGVGADAGQAAAHLARALLTLGRIEEAAEIAAASGELAGQNLQTAIASRAVRAELASLVGDHERALALADEAVAIAADTDLTMDHAAAARGLAAVAAAAGRSAEAATAKDDADRLFAEKGAVQQERVEPGPRSAAAAGEISNAAAEVEKAFWNAVRECDHDTALALLGEDWRSTDTRGGSFLDFNAPELRAFLAELADTPRDLQIETIAVRGDRLALNRFRNVEPDRSSGTPVRLRDYLQLTQLHEEGLIERTILYEHEDLRTALDELTRCYRDGEGAEFAEIIDLAWRLGKSQDTPTDERVTLLAELCWDDLQVVDHQPHAWPDTDFATISTETAWLENGRMFTSEYLRIAGDAILLRNLRGLDDDLVRDNLVLITMRDGKADRIEFFAAEQRDQASARFDELTSAVPANLASRQLEQFWRLAYRERDLDAAFALLRDSFVSTDHRRLVSSPTLTKDEVRGFLELFIDESKSEIDHEFEVLTTRGDHLVLARTDPRDGRSGFGQEMLQLVEVDSDGLAVRAVSYSPADRDRAQRDLESRAGVGPVDNQASALLGRIYHLALEAGAWEAAMELVADDWEGDDRRPLVGTAITKADLADFYASAVDDEAETRTRVDVIDTAGEELAICSATVLRGASPFVSPALIVVETDGSQLRSSTVFEIDDLDGAAQELERRRFRGAEGAAFVETLDLAWSYRNLFYDLDTYRSLLTDDFELVDHRAVSFGRMNADEFVDVLANSRDVTGSRRFAPGPTVAIDHGVVLNDSLISSSEASWPVLMITVYRGDLMERQELFDVADRDRALARFEQLRPGRPAAPTELANRATEGLRAFYSAMFDDRDLDTAMAFMTDDFVGDDRRGLVGSTIAKPDFFENYRELLEHEGRIDWTVDVLAVAGERVALTHVTTIRSGSGFATEFLLVPDADETGLCTAVVAFGTDDLDAATAEMNRRYRVGEGAEFAATLDIGWHSQALFKDPPSLRDHLTDDFELVDHRPVSFDTLDRDGYIDLLNDGKDLIGQRRLRARRTIALDHGVILSEAVAETDEMSWSWLMLAVHRDGRTCRQELFEVVDLDAALARFDELRPGGLASTELHNRATAAMRAFYTAMYDKRDLERGRAMLSDDFVGFDNRPLVAATVEAGVLDENFRELLAHDRLDWTLDTLAVAGDSLALSRIEVARPGSSFSSSYLMVNEVDSTGRGIASWAFESDDVDAAHAELDRRYLLGEGAEFAATLEQGERIRTRLNEPDRLRDELAEDFVAVDHRSIGFGELNRDDYIATLTAGRTMTGGRRLHLRRRIALDHGIQLNETLVESDDLSWPMLILVAHRDDVVHRQELYDVADLDAALTRFEELRPGASRSVPEPAPLRNRASEIYRALLATLHDDQDPDAAWALLSDEFVTEDRRAFVGVTIGPEQFAANWASVVGADEPVAWTFDVLSVLGERVAVCRWSSGDTWETRFLTVGEIDEDGLGRLVITFEPDDLTRAIAAAEERYLGGEGAPFRTLHELSHRVADADHDTWPELITDDFTFVDHTAIGFGEQDADGFLAVVGSIGDVARAQQTFARRILRTSHTAVLVELFRIADDSEWVFLSLFVRRGDRLCRLESFDPADIDAAVARFDELTASERPPPHNRAVDALLASTAAVYDDRDPERAIAMSGDGWYFEDRRSLMSTGGNSPEGMLQTYFAEVLDFEGEIEWDAEVLAIRGDNIAAVHLRFARDGSGFGSEVIEVATIDEGGLFVREIMFDVDDLDAALAEMDEQYAGEDSSDGRPRGNRASAVDLAFRAAVRQRDMGALAELVANDAVFVDHRTLMARPVDTLEGVVESVHAYTDQAMTHTHELVSSLGENVALVEVTISSDTGFAVRLYTVTQIDDAGRMCRFETFAADDFHLAQRCAAELWLDDDGADVRPAIEPLLDLTDAFAASDLEAVGALLAPDFRHVVTKPLSTDGTTDSASFLQNMQVWLELSGTIRAIGRGVVRATAHGCVWLNDTYATDPTGMVTQWSAVNTLLVSDGLLSYWEEFEPEDVGTAIARFEELTATPKKPTNLVVEAFRHRDSVGAGGFDPRQAFGGAVIVDHRSGVIPLESVEDMAASVAAFDEQDMDFSTETIAWRGELLGLLRMTRSTPSGMRTVMHHLIRSDVGGRATRLEIFDEDQLDEALRRLDELWWDDEEQEFRPCGELLRLFGDRIFAADWEGVRELLHPDFRHVLNKKLEVGPFDAEGFIENGRIWKDLAGSIQLVIREVVRHTDSAALLRQDLHGLDEQGLESQWSGLVVGVVTGGRLTRWEEFEPEDLDAAIARFDELTGESTGV